MKNYFKFLFWIMLLSKLSIAQNPNWILSSYKFNLSQISPLPTSSGGYDTTITPKAASNMQLDAQGNILFFIIDNTIYDRDGELIGTMSGYVSESQQVYYCASGFSGSEHTIVPDPENCFKYYIFAYVNSQQYCSGDYLVGFKLIYATLDFSQPRPYSTTPPLGQPCPSGNLLKSSFTGFNTAIDANGSGTTETVTIQQSNECA